MASNQYIDLGTAVVWTNTGGDEVLDLGGLAASAVRVGAFHDWGVDPRPEEYILIIKIDGFDTAPVIDQAVATHISESYDGTIFSGPESPSDTADGAGSAARLANMLGPFLVKVHSTTAGDNLVAVYEFRSAARYMAPVVYNATEDALLSTADAHTITIIPKSPQSQ